MMQTSTDGRVGRRGVLPFVLVLGSVVSLAVGCGHGPREPRAQSVILITIDTLRADRLGAYGYARATSPRLDRLFARGVRFANAFATCSQTSPSHASLLTGKYACFHSIGIRNGKYRLADFDRSLAERCRDAGMRTAAVVSNFVLHHRYGLDRGFDSYDDDFPDAERNRSMPEQTADHAVDKALALLDDFGKADGDGDGHGSGDGRFFLWLHLQDPHGPYDPPSRPDPPLSALPLEGSPRVVLPEHRTLGAGEGQLGLHEIPAYQVVGDQRAVDDYVRRYDEEIAFADRQLGRLFDALDADGRLDDTLVVITADHGEALGEDGFWFAHGHSLGPDQTHVPLAFVGAGLPAGGVIESPVSNLVAFATILAALGIDDAPQVEQSDNLWPALSGTAPMPPTGGYANCATQDAAFTGSIYLRHDRKSDRSPFVSDALPAAVRAALQPGEQLHILAGASGTTAPSADELVAQVEDLRVRMQEFVRLSELAYTSLAPQRIEPAPLDEADIEKLRELGYIK